jgi:hypothetical protein
LELRKTPFELILIFLSWTACLGKSNGLHKNNAANNGVFRTV